MWEYPCVACVGLVFWCRAVFSMDAYRLFPPHVLAVILLIGGVQMWRLVLSPGVLSGGGSSRAPPKHAMGVEAACNRSWSSRRQCPAA